MKFGVLATSVMGMLVVGGFLFWFSAQRILRGSGAYERDFQTYFGNDTLTAVFASVDLALSAPFETLARLVASDIPSSVPMELHTFTAFGSILASFGFSPDLYQITSTVSSPYYMNTATFIAAPFLDFGFGGVLLVSALMGLTFGLIDRTLRTDQSMAGMLLRYYCIYLALFGLYEFIPVRHLSWVPVALALFAIKSISKTSIRLVDGKRPAKPCEGNQDLATGGKSFSK